MEKNKRLCLLEFTGLEFGDLGKKQKLFKRGIVISHKLRWLVVLEEVWETMSGKLMQVHMHFTCPVDHIAQETETRAGKESKNQNKKHSHQNHNIMKFPLA